MGASPNPDCFTCGKDIHPDDRVVIVSVTRGRFNSETGEADYAPSTQPFPDDDVPSIFHESCYLQKGMPPVTQP